MTAKTTRSMGFRLGLLALVALAVVAIAVLAGGADEDSGGDAAAPAAAERGLRGIPQSGTALGDPDAPVTMVEFADLQCPFCAEYDREVLPTLIDRYVRTGKLRLELRLLRFIGPDSDRLARTAAGAAAQDRMWQVSMLAYARQGAENSGYATNEFLNGLVRGAGLERVDAGAGAERLLRSAEREARRARVEATPSFLIGPTGGTVRHFHPERLEPDEFVARIEQELR